MSEKHFSCLFTPVIDGHSSQNPPQKLEIIVKMEGKPVEEPRKQKATEGLKKDADVIVLISDDDDDVMVVTPVPKTEKMNTTVKDEVQEEMKVGVRVEHQTEKMETTMKDEAQEEMKVEVEAQEKAATVKENDTWLDFVSRHFTDNVNLNTEAQISAILNPTQLHNIRQICSRWPYCLYLYVGLKLGRCQNTGVVLVGYLNQVSGDSVVRPLLTLQMNAVEMDSQTSADTDAFTDAYAAHDDARLLVEALKKNDISLANVAVFYCNAPHPRMSRVFVSKLQAFNPKLVSLCGLPGMAARACEAGLLASFSGVVDLVRDIHYHYYTCPSASGSLKGLFADAESFNPSLPLSAQCSFIIHAVQRMVSSWRGLMDYFKSLRQGGDTYLITNRLMDNKFKLRFVFLSHILEPLRALQELQQSGTAAVAVELQLTSMLVNSYAASILRPSVAERFLRKRDPHLLQYRTELLLVTEVHVGARAREFLWATAVVDLGEEERTDFMKDAACFYKAALQSLTESLPEHLGEVALRNIDRVLKHSDTIQVRRFISVILSSKLCASYSLMLLLLFLLLLLTS